MAQPRILLALAMIVVALGLALAQPQHPGQGEEQPEQAKLKRTQIEGMLKADRDRSIEDAALMVKLSEELKAELEKNDKIVLSVAVLRKAEEVEKLAKRIRGRLRRY